MIPLVDEVGLIPSSTLDDAHSVFTGRFLSGPEIVPDLENRVKVWRWPFIIVLNDYGLCGGRRETVKLNPEVFRNNTKCPDEVF